MLLAKMIADQKGYAAKKSKKVRLAEKPPIGDWFLSDEGLPVLIGRGYWVFVALNKVLNLAIKKDKPTPKKTKPREPSIPTAIPKHIEEQIQTRRS